MQEIIHGDCLEKLKEIPTGSIDCIVTDPPYGYSFMGKDWDKAVVGVETWKECLRVLKPGAFAFVMSAPRQDVLSRMMVNLADAGFKTDFTSIYWTYASGFPKAMNIGKMVQKRKGVEATETDEAFLRRNPVSQHKDDYQDSHGEPSFKDGMEGAQRIVLTDPQAKALDGSYGGFQPKPAVEVIIVCMKPLSEKTYVDQAMKNGKGVTWLDDCRVPTTEEISIHAGKVFAGNSGVNNAVSFKTAGQERGRFPANLLISNRVLDTIQCVCDTQEEEIPTADEDLNSDEAGIVTTTKSESRTPRNDDEKLPPPFEVNENQKPIEKPCPSPDLPSSTSEGASQSEGQIETENIGFGCEPLPNVTDTSASSAVRPNPYTSTTSNLSPDSLNSVTKCPMGASCAHLATGKRRPTESNQHFSRFFDLDAWAKTLPFLLVAKASKREKNEGLDGFEEKTGNATYGEYEGTPEHTTNTTNTTKNTHATVKPVKLMSYLITLGTREGDTVLDPFLGSGTTGVAAKMLGRKFIGIERESEYVEIAKARLNAIQPCTPKTPL